MKKTILFFSLASVLAIMALVSRPVSGQFTPPPGSGPTGATGATGPAGPVCGSNNQWFYNSSGVCTAGGTFDGTFFNAPGFQISSAGNKFYWSGRSTMGSTADGVLLFQNNAGSDFSRIVLGGTSASFPGLKRSGTRLQSRLADDSAFAGFDVASGSITSPSSIDPGCTVAGDLGRIWVDSTSAVTTHFKVCADVASNPVWISVF